MPDSRNRAVGLQNFLESELADYVDDLPAIVDFMTTVRDELGQYKPLFPDKNQEYWMADGNLNPSSFMRLRNGKLALVDFNRITLSNNEAFDASTVIAFLTGYPDLQRSFYYQLWELNGHGKQFKDQIIVDLMYNRVSGELVHMCNKLFAEIKGSHSEEQIKQYQIKIKQLFGFLQEAHDRRGIFASPV